MPHSLKVEGNKIFLDGFKVNGILEYEIKCSAQSQFAELNLKLIVNHPLKVDDTKKKTEEEVPVPKQSIKVYCNECLTDIEVTKICHKCSCAYEDSDNFCAYCGEKLKDINL